VYLSWMITLVGGLVAATWPLLAYERAETRPWPGARFADAIRILALLHQHRGRGGATPRQIRAELRSGFSDSETLLEQLRAEGWIARAQGPAGEPRWVLMAEPGALRVADVFYRFAFDPVMARRKLDADDTALDHGVARVAALIETGLDVTLAEAFEVTPAQPATQRTAR
jgi:membrane protein